ncbi:MAG: hypothetical protein L0J60_11045 [Psychroflexus sp.]|nr:hypothetical protein [Psychroflexus sp.]
MKSLLISFSLFLLLSTSVFGQQTAKIHIGESSQIIIVGKSNVNKFDCDYESSITDREKAIIYKKIDNTLQLKNAKLRLKSKTFDCGGSRINNDFDELLEVKAHPYIHIDFNRIDINTDHYHVFSKISIAKYSNDYDFSIKKNSENRYVGEVEIDINDFGMEAPRKMMGLIVVDNHIKINFDLDLNIE